MYAKALCKNISGLTTENLNDDFIRLTKDKMEKNEKAMAASAALSP